jgi:hypothetical protein
LAQAARAAAQLQKAQTVTIRYLAPLRLLRVAQVAQGQPRQVLAKAQATMVVLVVAAHIVQYLQPIIREERVIRLLLARHKAIMGEAVIPTVQSEFVAAVAALAEQEVMHHQPAREEPAAREQRLAFLVAA